VPDRKPVFGGKVDQMQGAEKFATEITIGNQDCNFFCNAAGGWVCVQTL